MFFTLSRLAVWLTSPIVYVVVVMLIAVFVSRRWLKVFLTVMSLGLLLLFSTPSVYFSAAESWIPRHTTHMDTSRHYVYCLLPGGFSGLDTITGQYDFADASDRLTMGTLLLKAGVVDSLIISGDGICNHYPDVMDSLMERLFGVDHRRMIYEKHALNTFENLSKTEALIGKANIDGQMLIVNSAIYMRRTMLCASKLGWQCDFYSVDYSYTHSHDWSQTIPSPYVADKWLRLIHEWVGYVAYWVNY